MSVQQEARQRCGFIGTGIMGSGMSRNILKHELPLSVYNRTATKAQTLVECGAQLSASPAELAEISDVLLICVTNDSALREVIEGSQGVLTGARLPSIVVDHSTVSPSTAVEVARRLGEHGVEFIDAPVSGGDIGAQNGTLAIMAGGTAEAFHAALPVMECYGQSVTHCGKSGSGQATKVINQVVVALTVCAMSEGLHLADRLGLDLSTTLSVIRGGAAGSWSLDNYAPRILKGDLAPGFRAKDMLKDLKIALNEVNQLDLQLPALELVTTLYERLTEIGEENLGNHALIELYRKSGVL